MFKKGQIKNIDDLNALKEWEIRALYKAKCEELMIPETDDQYTKFRDNCIINSIDGKLNLHNFNLGPKCAKVIASVIANNPNFRHYILSDNFIGNQGIKLIADAL